jgi:hypothetical protein
VSEHTVYAHGIRGEGETDAAAAQRIAREHIGAHAREARVTQASGDRVVVAATLHLMRTIDGDPYVMIRATPGDGDGSPLVRRAVTVRDSSD